MSRILVIEDESNIQKLVRVNLAASGHQVLVAADGEEGLRLAQEEKPDLILLDLMLPGISGWDILGKLKTLPEVDEAPVVLIITAAIRAGDEEKARAMGAAGYVVKPFTAEELLRQVSKLLGKEAQ